MSLVAVTTATTGFVSAKLNGCALNVATGIVQVLALMMVEELSALQLVKSFSNVPVLVLTVSL